MTYMTYFLTLAFFILALMSKPMAVSLPVVLLILDWHPFGRISSYKTFRTAFIEKLPFIALCIGSSILTILAQEKAMVLNYFVPWQARVLVAARAIFAYLGKMLLPIDLSPFYPYSGNVFLLSPGYFLPLVLLVGLTAACLVISKRQKIWLSLWAYYVVTLVPVLGIVQVGRQAMADRYTYLPSIGPFIIAGLFFALIARKVYNSNPLRDLSTNGLTHAAERRDITSNGVKRRNTGVKIVFISSALSLVIFMSYLTYRQIGIWNNSVDFWTYVIQKEPDVSFAYYDRGLAFFGIGLTDKAIADYDKAIALDPGNSHTYNNRGLAFEKLGELDKAIADYDKAITLDSGNSRAYNNRGFVFAKTGQLDKALADFDKAIALDPGYSQTYNNRGVILERAGKLDKAISDYDKVISLLPDESQSYNNRAVVFEKIGRFDKAVEDYNIAIALAPSNADLYYNRGNAYDSMGQFDKAIADYDKAITLNPRDSQAYNNRGFIFEKMGELDKAIADYDKAVALNPSNAEAYNNRFAALGKKSGGPAKQGRTAKTMKDMAH